MPDIFTTFAAETEFATVVSGGIRTAGMRTARKVVVFVLACWLSQQAGARAQAQPSTQTQPQERPGKTSAVVLGTFASVGPSTVVQPETADGTPSPALTGERRPLYRLRKSDTVEIDFTFVPELNQIVSVLPDGFLTLRDLPALYVEGMTVAELQAAVAQAYAPTLHNPAISIVLKDFDKPYFFAGGQLEHPGKYELHSDTTVTEAVAMAGGFTSQAKHSQVVLFRRVSGDLAEARVINLKAMLKSRNLREDLHLRPGDMIYVPQNTLSKLRRLVPASDLSLYANPSQF